MQGISIDIGLSMRIILSLSKDMSLGLRLRSGKLSPKERRFGVWGINGPMPVKVAIEKSALIYESGP